MKADVHALARHLASRTPVLVRELLPAGKRHGQEWRVGSLAGEPGNSLGVHLAGARAGVWSDFATGEVGDALDLVAQVLFRGEVKDAIAWARRWLGLAEDAPVPAVPAVPAVRPVPARAAKDDAERRRRAAVAIWLAGAPVQPGDAVAGYLAGRGIDLAELGRVPRALRCHSGLFNGESQQAWPAMVAAICDEAGRHIATHRTWLCRKGAGWSKAPLRTAKATLGSYAGGTIRLWRGASGKPLAQAPAGETVVIGEGIETCLSVAIACPQLRVLAAVSLGNMARVTLPPAIGTVILAADHDGGNEAARRGLQHAVDALHRQGRKVLIAMPATPGRDWNDELVAA